MTERSKTAIRGDLVSLIALSLMLSFPVYAAPLADGTSQSDGKVKARAAVKAPAGHPVVHTAKAQTPSPARKVAAKSSTERSVKAGPNARPATMAKISTSQRSGLNAPVKRVALAAGGKFDHALIDDGTFWHERGSVTTWQQTGMASWYGGSRWQGHRTSSGDRYDQNQLTAAHATLPIGTRVRVVRADGRGSVVVTINDRPGTRTRIIDLSRAAAKELGMLGTGVAMVTLQPM